MKRLILGLIIFNSILYAGSNVARLCMIEQNISIEKKIQACSQLIDIFNRINNKSKEEIELLETLYYNQGQTYMYDLKDYKNAFKIFKIYYNFGFKNANTDVLTKLGYMYELGKGIKQNKILAYKYYLEGAKFGNVDCQHNLDILCKESPWACK